LVRKIASEENISAKELDSISGSGINGRVQKSDVLEYIESRSKETETRETKSKEVKSDSAPAKVKVNIYFFC
jgi:2-oxoglutarate dehydrogenase E2 component (dihydrolipoamide succinyltransferase)